VHRVLQLTIDRGLQHFLNPVIAAMAWLAAAQGIRQTFEAIPRKALDHLTTVYRLIWWRSEISSPV